MFRSLMDERTEKADSGRRLKAREEKKRTKKVLGACKEGHLLTFQRLVQRSFFSF